MLVDNFHVQNITSWGNTQVTEMDEMLKKTGKEEWIVYYYWSFKNILEERGSMRNTKGKHEKYKSKKLWGECAELYLHFQMSETGRNKNKTEVCSYAATKLISLAEL